MEILRPVARFVDKLRLNRAVERGNDTLVGALCDKLGIEGVEKDRRLTHTYEEGIRRAVKIGDLSRAETLFEARRVIFRRAHN